MRFNMRKFLAVLAFVIVIICCIIRFLLFLADSNGLIPIPNIPDSWCHYKKVNKALCKYFEDII